MALISGRCFIGNTLAMASTNIIPPKMILSPNKLNRLLIPQQGKQFSNHSYRRGSQLKKKMLHTVRAASEEDGEESEWAYYDNRRFLRATCRVKDLERSIKFYTRVLGMTLFGRRNLIRESAAFVGFDTPDSQIQLELIYRRIQVPDHAPFDIGTGFGHFGISTPDIDQYVSDIKAKGGVITQQPSGPGPTENAFAQDPDGYLIELVERRIQHLRISHLNLRVTNLQLSTDFYEGALRMKLLMSIPIPEAKVTLHLMGYSDELELKSLDYKELPTTYLELVYADDGTGQYTKGNAYSHLSIGTDDVNKSADALKLAAQKLGVGVVSEEPQSSTTKSTAITFLDPDLWTIVFYDNEEFDKEIKGNQ